MKEKYITRHTRQDSWELRMPGYRGITFSDSEYGTPEKGLKEAVKLRTKTLGKMKAKGKSGEENICLTKRKGMNGNSYGDIVLARYYVFDAQGKKKRKSKYWSVDAHGKSKAMRDAKAFVKVKEVEFEAQKKIMEGSKNER